MRDFSLFTTFPYAGNLQQLPASVRALGPNNPKAGLVRAVIDWSKYVASGGSSFGVVVNLFGNSPGIKLDGAIRCVYIDNSASDVPAYVQFPDTGFTAYMQPYSAGWVPVLTNVAQATVYVIGLSTTPYPLTSIIFTDAFVEGFSNIEKQFTYPQWKSSPVIQRGDNVTTPGYASPALGDQLQCAALNLQQAGGGFRDAALFGGTAVTAGKFIYVTSIDLNVFATVLTSGGAQVGYLQILSTGASGILLNFNQFIGTASSLDSRTLYNVSGLQLRLSGNESWFFRAQCFALMNGNGTAQATLSYTISPT